MGYHHLVPDSQQRWYMNASNSLYRYCGCLYDLSIFRWDKQDPILVEQDIMRAAYMQAMRNAMERW